MDKEMNKETNNDTTDSAKHKAHLGNWANFDRYLTDEDEPRLWTKAALIELFDKRLNEVLADSVRIAVRECLDEDENAESDVKSGTK